MNFVHGFTLRSSHLQSIDLDIQLKVTVLSTGTVGARTVIPNLTEKAIWLTSLAPAILLMLLLLIPQNTRI